MKLCPSLPRVLHGVSINSLRIGFPQKRTVVFNSWNLLLSPRSTTFLAKVVKPCVYSLFWHGHPTSIFSWGTEMYVEFDLLVFAPGQCSFTSLILTSFFFFLFQYDLTLTEECRWGGLYGFRILPDRHPSYDLRWWTAGSGDIHLSHVRLLFLFNSSPLASPPSSLGRLCSSLDGQEMRSVQLKKEKKNCSRDRRPVLSLILFKDTRLFQEKIKLVLSS